MADPTVNQEIERRGMNMEILSYGLDKAVQHLYIGQMAMLDATGYLVAAANTAACRFCGVLNGEKNQVAAAAADGTNELLVQTKGQALLTVTSVAVTDIGKPVWVSDSGILILTPTEVFAGWVAKYDSANTAWVELAGDFQPRRFEVLLSVPASTASDSVYSALWTATRDCKILGAWVNAFTYPDYATSVLDVDKWNLDDTAAKEVVAATDIDAKTASTAIALTLSSTAADLLLTAGDSVYALQTLGSTEAVVSEGLAVTLELEEYGRPNA